MTEIVFEFLTGDERVIPGGANTPQTASRAENVIVDPPVLDTTNVQAALTALAETGGGPGGDGSGAPIGASYIVVSASPTLTADRVLTAGSGVTITDAGAQTGTVTIAAAVESVAGKTGAVTLTASDVGLGNVTNAAQVTSVSAFSPISLVGSPTAPTIALGNASSLFSGAMSAADKVKLDGIATGATANTGTVTSVTAGTGLTGGTITASGTIAADFGTAAGTICQGNDGRLSDERTPTDNTVSTAKLQDGAVTYAKLQDVSATDKILGRSTAGSGDVEEIACTAAGRALLDDADAAAQRTTLGLGSAATSATSDFAAASHSHGNISTAGSIGSTANLPLITTTGGLVTTGAFGTSANQFAEGNHTHAWADITSKPSDFTPSAHTHGLTDAYVGHIETPTARTYYIELACPVARTITGVYAKTSTGTVDLTVKNGADTVWTGDGVDSTTGVSVTTGLSNQTVSAGGTISLIVDAIATPADLQFSLRYTAATGAIS